ncbi:pilus assembly FimT family protein [Thioalkalivibrio sulfidiphilus]|uniref:pilus assembly FimT family protein n=1 Tax=Thioalkalivibrio sulfidiphilus TaxID=1033854 RepID=UPI000365DD8D|nr:prepilin-type N-terminal cleavage/methylation domain-containing protein [Thioalkalivibrio sulfidiphilus]
MINRGFTLIELVTVIVLLGAISVFALPRMMDRTAVDAAAFEQELKAALRHGRALALASGCDVQVQITPAAYGVFVRAGAAGQSCGSGAFTHAVPRPIQSGAYQGVVPSGLSVGTLTITFDALGRTAGGSVAVENRTITVSGAGYVG